mgnify:CR=1 FL=1|jgi:hypothetical protein
MARYALIRAGVVVNVARAEPDWPGLADYDQAVELAEDQAVAPGHTFDGSVFAAPAPRVPAAVTMRQARLALLGANLLSSVDTAIDALPEPTKSAARIEWEYSNELQRGNALVAALTPALGLTSEQVDALFIAASTL